MDASEELAGATHVGAYRLVRRLFQVVEGVDTLKEGLLARRVVSPHILNPLRSYVGLWRNMARILSGSRPDMKRRRRRELWCLGARERLGERRKCLPPSRWRV